MSHPDTNTHAARGQLPTSLPPSSCPGHSPGCVLTDTKPLSSKPARSAGKQDSESLADPGASPGGGFTAKDDGMCWAPNDDYYAQRLERAWSEAKCAARYALLPCLIFAAMVLLMQACGLIK